MWLILAAVIAVCAVGVLAVLFSMRGRIQDMIRTETEAYLKARFHSTFEFKNFSVSINPAVHVVITGAVLCHNGRTDIPPLIEVAKVFFNANVSGLLANKVTVSTVHLEGLKINTPPREPGAPPLIYGTNTDLAKKYPFTIGEVMAENVMLTPLPKDPTKTTHPF